jgi:hypothetical protein
MFDKFQPADWINLALLGVSTCALIAAAIAAYAAYRQFQASVRATRATLLKDLYLQFRSDEVIAQAFYKIEYDQFQYSRAFHGSDEEPKIDRLLTFCDLVCAMHGDGSLTGREMLHFKYHFKRIYENPEIQKYFLFLDAFFAENNMHRKSFEQFQIYASKL